LTYMEGKIQSQSATFCENQPCADLGNGTYLNPILAGDYADLSIVRVGSDYYMTHSSSTYVPGLLIWHSHDLVNWKPVTNALSNYDGDLWAPELLRHHDLFYIYYKTTDGVHVITASTIEGKWSKPINLMKGSTYDPGHVVGPDAKRYLHLSDGHIIELASNGLSVCGELRKVYDGWPIPEDWRTEGLWLEGAMLFSKDGYYYLIVAEGGTAGPATSHMVVAARSKTPWGPWEHSPYNPVIHTTSRQERWWSRGHGSLIDTPNGDWWILYHAYENGYYNLGRQTLLEPIEWTSDGWFRIPSGIDPEKPIRKPVGEAVPHGLILSDDFAGPGLQLQWRFFGEHDRKRYSLHDRSIWLQGKGSSLSDSPPMACIAVNHAYKVEVDVELFDDDTEAALVLFYNHNCHTGIFFGKGRLFLIRHAGNPPTCVMAISARRVTLRLINDCHEVDFYFRTDESEWKRVPEAVEVSGFHHNVFGGFLSLRIGLSVLGTGTAKFSHFRYRGLEER